MTALPHEGVLSTLAEMSIAVVGFSIVVGILRPRSQSEERRLFTLRGVAAVGLLGAVMSAFPLVAHAYGLPEDATWRLASGIAFVWAVIAIAADFVRLGRGLPIIATASPVTSTIIVVIISVNLGLLVANVVVPGPSSGARYATVMLLALAQAGLMFLWAAFDAGRAEPAA